MKTRLISALLACMMLASLTACANEEPGKTPDESTVQTTENVTTEETT
ncbi:MAG: ABC transporter substrate-binding protein, partial [Clostridiales bacterium]|nr:ABC transporter substrate-binding protein [Clostridiales bacterium]